MKLSKIILALIISISYFNVAAQFTQNKESEIVIGNVISLYSETLKEQREIWVHVPEDFNPSEKYPVIYVLDAKQHFYVLVGMMKRLLPWQMPKSIVVGIVNTDRTRDFTPTNVPFQRGHKSETSGGAHNFLMFIEEELKPFINNKYSTENNHTVIGHSTGGLFVLYSFLNHQDVFDNYLAIDASLWWDNEKLVNETQTLLQSGNRKEKPLYVSVANSIGKTLDTLKVRNDKSVPTEQIRANLKFHDILVKNNNKLNYKWEYFKNEDHGNITVPAQYNGLRFVFSWFEFPEMWRFNAPKKYSVEELIEPYYKHYNKLSVRMKRDIKPDWDLINDVGDHLLFNHKLPKKALAFYEMNVHFYSHLSKSYLALGNYHLRKKNNSEAIKHFRKAVEIDNNIEAKKKLDALER